MMRLCWIGPGTLRRCYDPRGVDAGGPIVARLRLSGESGFSMSDLPILDPDWRPSSDDEALEAGELLKAATDRLVEWLEEMGRDPWRRFLKEHPELTTPTPIEFTDGELLEALRRAEELRLRDEWRSKAKWPGVYTCEVGRELTGDLIRYIGDAIRIGRALGRLKRAGKVIRTRAYGPPLWAAMDDA